MPARATETKPLPLSDTLHDLAVLRASDVDLAAFLPDPSEQTQKKTTPKTEGTLSTSPDQASGDETDSERDRLVTKSYEYVREGRAAIRLLHRGDVDSQGGRVDKVRSELEEILKGLGTEEDGRR